MWECVFVFGFYADFYHTTDHLGGWVCFVVSIFWVGVLTGLIGDVASHFGCTLGIRDAVTAISIVALGTSVPGNNEHVTIITGEKQMRIVFFLYLLNDI
jgi:Ca2+/Na+ antiporter